VQDGRPKMATAFTEPSLSFDRRTAPVFGAEGLMRKLSVADKLLGRPLASEEEDQQRGAVSGIGVFGLDAHSSAAYGPEAALTVLVKLGAIGVHRSDNGRRSGVRIDGPGTTRGHRPRRAYHGTDFWGRRAFPNRRNCQDSRLRCDLRRPHLEKRANTPNQGDPMKEGRVLKVSWFL